MDWILVVGFNFVEKDEFMWEGCTTMVNHPVLIIAGV